MGSEVIPWIVLAKLLLGFWFLRTRLLGCLIHEPLALTLVFWRFRQIRDPNPPAPKSNWPAYAGSTRARKLARKRYHNWCKHVIDRESNPRREAIHVRYRNDEFVAFKCSEIREKPPPDSPSDPGVLACIEKWTDWNTASDLFIRDDIRHVSPRISSPENSNCEYTFRTCVFLMAGYQHVSNCEHTLSSWISSLQKRTCFYNFPSVQRTSQKCIEKIKHFLWKNAIS